MSNDKRGVAVEAPDPKYFGLKHMPGALPLDGKGKAVWPADQFTFRLIQDGAIKEQASGSSSTDAAAAQPVGTSKNSTSPAAGTAPADRNRS